MTTEFYTCSDGALKIVLVHPALKITILIERHPVYYLKTVLLDYMQIQFVFPYYCVGVCIKNVYPRRLRYTTNAVDYVFCPQSEVLYYLHWKSVKYRLWLHGL